MFLLSCYNILMFARISFYNHLHTVEIARSESVWYVLKMSHFDRCVVVFFCFVLFLLFQIIVGASLAGLNRDVCGSGINFPGVPPNEELCLSGQAPPKAIAR